MQTGRPSSRPRPPFGTRLHTARETAGLSQAQVAEKLGISARAYAFWEREPVALKADQLAALADIFDVTADELIGRQELKKRGGPTGRLRVLFEQAAQLPRTQQQRIAANIEDALAAYGARQAG
jgi:transcriptional regulator with XRE-family HTH domain